MSSTLYSQQYINITFRHYPTNQSVVRAFLPGTFNNWGPNSNGVIFPTASSIMTYVDSLKFYIKKLRLKVGDTHNYKFHEHDNDSGIPGKWITDPLNPFINYNDNNNSILYVKNAMIFEIYPPNDAVVNNPSPTLVAGVFAAEGDSILYNQSNIYIDGSLVVTFAGNMNESLSLMSYQLPKLSNGNHNIRLKMVTQNGKTAEDSVNFAIVSGDVFFLTPSIDSVWAGQRTIRWRVNMQSTKLQSMTLKQLDTYPISIPSAETDKEYEYDISLEYGENRYIISVTDTAGLITESDTLKLYYQKPQKPEPEIIIQLSTDKKLIRLTGKGNDPQCGQVSYLWSTQTTNTADLPGIDGRTEDVLIINTPSVPGDYAIKLVVTDGDGYSNSTVNFFTVQNDSSVIIPNLETAPSWVVNARIYCMFIHSYTSRGTFQAAVQNLEHIKNMGFNVIWVLPVMDVEGKLDRYTNIGYNIIDFYNVEPAYGTNDDFKDFVREAHELGLRVILDITPNHTSKSHPIALDVRNMKKYSRYYDFYQHKIIPHDDNGLGQYLSPDGIVYYGGFTSSLLNWNWEDDEARQYMLDVYRYWLKEYDIDGFRLDAYWAPHRKYGRDNFDRPLRAALRSAKADIMILGETNGTGVGSEVYYADQDGGLNIGYDWLLKDTIWNYPSIISLNDKLYNGGYRPGPNSFFLRFLENQDEDRVTYRYNSIERTIPVSTAIFMATGIPQLYQGQEVGMGLGMGGDKDYRLRSLVNWQNPAGKALAPHYQKLAQIRAQFPAFSRQMEDTNADGSINSSDKNTQPTLKTSDGIYAFGRPFENQNGIVVMNFTDQLKKIELELNLPSWAEFSGGFNINQTYFLNNLYDNTSQMMIGSELNKLNLNLYPYGVEIYTISTSEEFVELPDITVRIEAEKEIAKPVAYQLCQNYPNPFNSGTIIRYSLSEAIPTLTEVKIYNIVGQEVAVLFSGKLPAGHYQVQWDGTDFNGSRVTSGVYLYSIKSGKFCAVKKLVLVK